MNLEFDESSSVSLRVGIKLFFCSKYLFQV